MKSSCWIKINADIKQGVFKHTQKTCLLRRMQAQTLPDATPPIGLFKLFSKIAVTFEPLMGF